MQDTTEAKDILRMLVHIYAHVYMLCSSRTSPFILSSCALATYLSLQLFWLGFLFCPEKTRIIPSLILFLCKENVDTDTQRWVHGLKRTHHRLQLFTKQLSCFN
jgi:hypothetical protein